MFDQHEHTQDENNERQRMGSCILHYIVLNKLKKYT